MNANLLNSMTFLNTAYTPIASMLDPIFSMAESELLINGKRLCVVALIGCGIKYAFANDPQSAKTAKDWGIRILAGLLIMILAGDIIPLFANMVSSV